MAIGSTVKLQANGQEKVYTIVGSNEANPANGRISNESLVGQKLIGTKPGDKIQVETPAGKIAYEVVEIL